MNERVLIIGLTGFFGCHMAEFPLEQGNIDVFVIRG
jgi:nucleoside-diphosphate-sugar epimerase